MIVSFYEENKAIVLFLLLSVVVLLLISVNIFLPIPVAIKHYISLAATLMIFYALGYFVVRGIRDMWETPNLERWQWFGMLATIILIAFFIMLSGMGYRPIDITTLFD